MGNTRINPPSCHEWSSKEQSASAFSNGVWALLQDGWKEGQYWDTADPYHSVRAAKHDDKGLVLIVGGEDHNTGIKPSEYEVGPPFGLLHN